jgi:hypothetical protein
MAGRQFSFFLGPADQLPFERAIRASGDVVFLKSWPRTSRPEIIADSVVTAPGKEILPILIARKEDIGKIVFTPVRGRDVFSCDAHTQPVIEFSRCYITDRFIRAGRLYRVDKYWGCDGTLATKSPEFVEWGERLYSLARRSLTRVEQGLFAGAEALKLRQTGVAFEGLDIAVGSIED